VTPGEPEIVRWTDDALPADVEALVAEAVAEGYDWIGTLPDDWRARPFRDAGEALFLAREGQDLLAMAVISRDPFVADAVTGRLRYIYVRATARRRGLAERFVRACLDRAEGRWRRLRLHTSNSGAAALYARYGFRPDGADPRSTHVRGAL
jgi:ribosomal protein S18 acetylase RimI-like enzyme